jgi:hypothetical protein
VEKNVKKSIKAIKIHTAPRPKQTVIPLDYLPKKKNMRQIIQQKKEYETNNNGN